MDIIRAIFFICTVLVLTGCAINNTPSTASLATPTTTDDASIKLAEAASSISQSLTNLNAIEKAAAPPVNDKVLPYPTSYDMGQLTSIDWTGPIEPLLEKIACSCNYKLRVLGKRPAIPVLITLTAKNIPLNYVIRDANFQAGSKASIVVYPAIQVIELRYAKG